MGNWLNLLKKKQAGRAAEGLQYCKPDMNQL